MEAISVVGSALLSTTFQWLITKLDSYQLLSNLAKQERAAIRPELKNWRNLLLKIHAVIEDAETKQITDPLIKIWLSEVRDLAFDMEDILDEFPSQVNTIAKPEAADKNKAPKVVFFVSCLADVGLGRADSLVLKPEISRKIREISDRLRSISAEINGLGLNLTKISGGDNNPRSLERSPTTSLVEPDHIYGREAEKEEIVQYLLRDDGNGADGVCINVIPIVGMGGIGKTALAQLIYNDERITDKFHFKAWVCVSEQLHLPTVTRIILEKVTTSSCCEINDLDSLQVRLKEELMGKKFLFVLDDVWSESYHQWDLLRKPFVGGAKGSRIIVTTRHSNVASMVGNVKAYHLRALPYDDCLALFCRHALGRRNFEEEEAHRNVKGIGEEIVQRCRGLPLAAKTLGGLLCGKRNCNEWYDILNSKLWDLPEDADGILPALRLSYYHLPSHLKQCFSYCAVFPKGYEFDKDELVVLWMAEGLIPQQQKGMKQMEDLGNDYFLDLLSRSFFQRASNHKESQYVMHDLINDLAQFVAGETCYNFTADKFKHDRSRHGSFEKVRYLSFMKQSYDTSPRFEMAYKMQSLRTFLSFSPFSHSFRSFLSNGILHGFLPKLRYLRALSLCDYTIKKLPDSIEELKHLRYLNLSRCSSLQCLPEAVTSLLYLQTLILHRCNKLSKLPATIGNLIHLRHLDITHTAALKEMPPGIGMLKSLLTLPKFVIGVDDHDGLRIRELNGLSHLRGQLSILHLHNVSDIQDVRHANLYEKEGIEEVKLEWSRCDFHNLQNETDHHEMQVLSWLKPHHNLKKLTIKFFGAKEFPSWIGDPLFSNVTHLELYHCPRIKSLPSLGRLISLKSLIIKGMVAVKTVGFEFYGFGSSADAFPSLNMLRFEDMLAWEEWTSSGCIKHVQRTRIFPCLDNLYIHNCPKLVCKLPPYLPSLAKLEICKCPQLTCSLVRFPSLEKLNLEACNEVIFRSMVHLTSLRTLKITNISHLSCLSNSFIQDLIVLEELQIEECAELTSLWEDGSNAENLVCLKHVTIKKCPLFGTSEGGEDQVFPSHNLEILELLDCNNLKRIPNVSFNMSSLRMLRIERCKALNSLHGIMGSTCLEKLKITNCHSLKSFPTGILPPTLRKLAIEDCELLQSLPEGIMSDGNDHQNLQHLQEVAIRNCPSLKTFPRGKFPTSLKTLVIEDCEFLQSLPEGIMCPEDLRLQGLSSLMFFPNRSSPKTLKSLVVFNCRRLESFPDGVLQHSKALETIEISHCTNLKTLPFDCFKSLTHLSKLVISRCDALESFPELLAPKLRFLRINRCKNLNSLPNTMHNLKSLKELKLKCCPNILSIPQGGLPPNLTHFFIDCENLKQATWKWGLDRLTSLRYLWLHHRMCPAEKVSLPASLVELYIRNMADLKHLPEGLLENLSCLQVLDVSGCHQLQSLPKQGLPPSLGSLRIEDCPLLQRWCLENGDYRRFIAHIPCLWIG